MKNVVKLLPALITIATLTLACDSCTKTEAKTAVDTAGTIAFDTCKDLPATPVEQVICEVVQGGVTIAKVVLSKRQALAMRAAGVDAGAGGL